MDGQESIKTRGALMTFDYEYVGKVEDVRRHIQECEGKHTQQAIYSTFHDALTQVCYGCQKIRTTIYITEKTSPLS